MSNINAAIGLAQLKKVDEFVSRRREIAFKYDRALQSLEGISLLSIDYKTVAPHIYVIRVLNNQRNALIQFLRDLDIETGISYIPNHLHSFYKEDNLSLPETEKTYKEILTLPLHCKLSDVDIDTIISAVNNFFKSSR